MLDVHIVLCVVKTRPPWPPLRFGLPNVNGTGAREAKKAFIPAGVSTNFPRECEVEREPVPSDLLAVIFEPELRRLGLSLVRSADPTLHLALHFVERVDLDQRLMLPAFDAAVQARQAAVHRIAENIRDRLARPGPTGLRAVSVPVELLADLGDALALEIPTEDQRDHAGLFVLDLEDAVHIIVTVRTGVGEERVRLLHGVVERFRTLQSSGPPQHLALVQVPFDAQLPEGLVLRLRRIVLKHLAGRPEAHVDLPEQEDVPRRPVHTVLAQEDLLPTDGRIRSRVRVDFVADEVPRAPAPLTPTVHPSRLQDDRRRVGIRQERPRPQTLLRFVESLDRHDRIVVRFSDDPIPTEEPGIDWVVKDPIHFDRRPGGVAFRPPSVRV